jgi:hypothetical protein
VRLEEKICLLLSRNLTKWRAVTKWLFEDWIAAVRKEEALASVNHSVAEVDQWENAGFQEEELRNKAKAAKEAYKAALRQELYDF